MRRGRPRVLLVLNHYLPGERAGGPVRSVANLVAHLGREIDFRVATLDRDHQAAEPYADVLAGEWVRRGLAEVFYLSPPEWSGGGLRRLVASTPHDVLYLNSYFASSTVRLLAARRLRRLPAARLVVAPRGEFGRGALGLKRGRKGAYLAVANAVRLHAPFVWHATNDDERARIAELTRPPRPVVVAPNLPSPVAAAAPAAPDAAAASAKRPGVLRIATLGRVTAMKNFAAAIEWLRDLPGQIEFDVYGPHEDRAYLARCMEVAAGLGPNARVRFPGAVPQRDVPRVLADYDLFVLPTLGENFGHAVYEALAVGRPVLVSDRTPWRGLADSGAGWDLPLEEPDRFRAALARCVEMDAPAHARMVAAALAEAERARSRAAATADAYRALFGAQRAGDP